MVARPDLNRLAAVSIAFFLTAPLCGGIAAQTQTRDSRQVNVDTARALLAEAITQEKETPSKEAALAADEALERYNEAAALPLSGAPRAPAGEVGINLTTQPTILIESEPNDTSGTATSIAAPLANARYLIAAGTISPGGDFDFYTFSAAAGARIWIEADTGGTQGGGAPSRDTVGALLVADGRRCS